MSLAFALLHVGITLYGGFARHDADIFSHYPLSHYPSISVKQLRAVEGFAGKIVPTVQPDVLVAMYEDDLHYFLHRNYTLERCRWSPPCTTLYKAQVLLGLAHWLRTKNQTLSASFLDAEDAHAWSLIEMFRI